MLHVRGECECSSTGHRLRLEYGNPGIKPDPEVVVLNLLIEEPEVGNDVKSPEVVEFHDEIGSDPLRVEIRAADGNGATVEIQDVT